MKKYLISASAFLLLAACQQEEAFRPVEAETGFIAEIENFGVQTRTSLNESNSVVWSENDLIAVFQGRSVADKFEVSASSAGKTTGSFKEVTSVGGGGFESGNEIPDNVAVYPYMEDLECANGMFAEEDAYAYKIENVYYPRIQMYQESSFPDDAFVMVAVTSGVKDNKLRFRNASGALRLRIKGDATVKSISIEGNADEPLGGYAVLKAYRDGSAPELESFGTSYGTVTLDCGNGVRLDEDTATEFIIALPPTDFENGFTVTIHPKDGEPDVRMTEKRNSVRRSRILNMPEITFGVPEGPSTGEAIDLNADGQTANSYIISEAGTYRFAAVKGNSSESVGDVASVELLWESFGTDETPVEGDLIETVDIDEGGGILFSTPEDFREGNAVIAAKDASGTILWSWHIWLTDAPEGQVYYNNAGTMMDRNLGATSATPGDVGALGLLYQWGRKDPFLGSSNISNDAVAKSTGSWPSAVSSSSSRGTVEYAVKNPMTFITATSSSDYDWHYSSRNNKLWQSEKTIYDPCPAGWRVPDGESNGVWSKALGSASSYNDTYDSSKEGIDFSGKFGNTSTIWYPASGCRSCKDGSLSDVGNYGYYWSVTLDSNYAYRLNFNSNGYVGPSSGSFRASGLSVRCFKEDSSTPPTETPKEYENLSAEGTANSYIVSQTGDYKFEAVKGNSYESVGSVSEVEVLWESFGTDVTPSVGDLVKEVSYSDGYILFSTADNFREGNAVIAAKDASGTILWSWHIWLTDEPEEQVYYNNAGTMMDRNLGATSAEPGDVGALGLLYQWGRKDPFLGSSKISSNAVAKSTGSWPSAVSSSSSRGTIEYAVKNPMTFIKYNSYNGDWYYTGSSSTDNTRWESEKTIYDPCPAGWRVPDGGSNGVWSKALGSSSYYNTYDSSKEGINFSGRFGNASPIWYSASGYRYYDNGSLYDVGSYGYFWSVTPNSYLAYYLRFDYDGSVYPSYYYYRARGQSVRCLKEDSSTPPTETPKEYENLSAEGTANSYIVSQTGDYKFEAVKGNSYESVGSVSEVEVLWESFGTDVTPSVGDLVKEVSYSDGYILFSTPSSFQEGNAVIAAKNSSGTILWSWHIWLTDEPEEQVYYNGAGTMMDRNLGATSAEPGEVGALGLLYQWGRKDPFLGSSNISSNTVPKYTGSWPYVVSSSSSRGTVEYAVKNPMTFIKYNSYNGDWYYTGSSSTDNTRWQSEKTIYDPCPVGWRVPDGGSNGVWSKALGSASSYSDTYDDSREGINFSGNFGSAFTIWYPASGYRYALDGSLYYAGSIGFYWSCTPDSKYACDLYFSGNGDVDPSSSYSRAYGQSVRCLQE